MSATAHNLCTSTYPNVKTFLVYPKFFMQIFQNLTTCCQAAWPQRPRVLQVSSSVTVHKSVSVHNFKNENFFGSLNFRWCRKSLIFASACVPFGSVLSLPRSQPRCVCVDTSKHKCHSTAGFLVLCLAPRV